MNLLLNSSVLVKITRGRLIRNKRLMQNIITLDTVENHMVRINYNIRKLLQLISILIKITRGRLIRNNGWFSSHISEISCNAGIFCTLYTDILILVWISLSENLTNEPPKKPPRNPHGTPKEPPRNPQGTPKEPPRNSKGTQKEPQGQKNTQKRKFLAMTPICTSLISVLRSPAHPQADGELKNTEKFESRLCDWLASFKFAELYTFIYSNFTSLKRPVWPFEISIFSPFRSSQNVPKLPWNHHN